MMYPITNQRPRTAATLKVAGIYLLTATLLTLIFLSNRKLPDQEYETWLAQKGEWEKLRSMMSDLDSLTRINKELISMDSIEVTLPGAVAGQKEKKEARLQSVRNSFYNTSLALTGVFKTHASALEKTFQQQVAYRKYLAELRKNASGACDGIQRACDAEKLALQSQIATLNGEKTALQSTILILQAQLQGGGGSAGALKQLQADFQTCSGELASIKARIGHAQAAYQAIHQLLEDEKKSKKWLKDRDKVDILYSKSADFKTKLDLITGP
jgi:predicted  nucleic acid-binding Zn-ribbon protein